MTLQDALKGCSSYPLPFSLLERISTERNIPLDLLISPDVVRTASYQMAKADVLLFLAQAPNVAQGGQNYSFTDEQRAHFRREAARIARQWGGEEDVLASSAPTYGYKGRKL